MSDDPVFTAVLDSLLERLAFFELCDDETLHPDIAVQQLEDAASRLSGLEPADRARLAAAIAARAERFQPPGLAQVIASTRSPALEALPARQSRSMN